MRRTTNTLPTRIENQKWMILRHNIARYGVQEQDYDWYIFNQPDIILKCATFWLIRLSNTWKRIKFRTFLNKLNLETFDTVLFDDRVNGVGKGYIASAADEVIVEKAIYNSADNYIDFECLDARAGRDGTVQVLLAVGLPVDVTWPPPEDIASGDAGGGGIGTGDGGIAYRFHGWHRSGRHGLRRRSQCRLSDHLATGATATLRTLVSSPNRWPRPPSTHNCNQVQDRD